jgi:hypothetical protein
MTGRSVPRCGNLSARLATQTAVRQISRCFGAWVRQIVDWNTWSRRGAGTYGRDPGDGVRALESGAGENVMKCLSGRCADQKLPVEVQHTQETAELAVSL